LAPDATARFEFEGRENYIAIVTVTGLDGFSPMFATWTTVSSSKPDRRPRGGRPRGALRCRGVTPIKVEVRELTGAGGAYTFSMSTTEGFE